MKVIGVDKLAAFKKKHADIRSRADSWLQEARAAHWHSSQDIKDAYPRASILGDKVVIFDIGQYRMKTKVDYKGEIVLIVILGTHDEYMEW